jgi:hypothetical protein
MRQKPRLIDLLSLGTWAIRTMTVSALDLSNPEKLLANIKEELLATGSEAGAEQLFCRR